MAKLLSFLCLTLLCLSLASGWQLRHHGGGGGQGGGGQSGGGQSGGGQSGGGQSGGGQSGGGQSGGGQSGGGQSGGGQGGSGQGGSSQGGNSQGGGSQGGSSGEKADLLTKEDYKGMLEDFVQSFAKASEKLGKVEGLSEQALIAGENGNWTGVVEEFMDALKNNLAPLKPKVEHLGMLLMAIAHSPKNFPPLDHCNHMYKLAFGDVKVEEGKLDEAKAVAFIEDLGCFQDMLDSLHKQVDPDEVDDPSYSEEKAMKTYFDVIERGIHIERAFHRFFEASHKLDVKEESSGDSKVNELIRLLKEFKLEHHK